VNRLDVPLVGDPADDAQGTTPDMSTTMLNNRPVSLVNVMSPNPSVVITTSVQ
jgi:hypothetical protein